jgi:uncharacterized membrane protein
MAEDPHSRELLQQLIERLDLLERLLAGNTGRLHDIERHLGMVRPPQSVPEPLARESGSQTHSALSQTKSQTKHEDLNASESSQPPTQPAAQTPVQPPSPPTPVAPPSSPEPALHTWIPEPAEPRATHPWMNEASATKEVGAMNEATVKEPGAARPYARREAAAPFALHVPVENSGVILEDDGGPAGVDSMPKRRDLESVVGGSWFNWIGILAVTFGIAFFLKFAFDQQWIGPAGRISFSALVGVTLLYVAERLRRRGLSAYAYVLSGGGILILYLADFAAYNFYHLIGHSPAFLLMAIVTTTAVLLSVRLNALPVAILGLVGGFLTPFLLSTGVDNEIGLFAYIALLDAGVLAVAYFQRWRSLDFLSFAGTVTITLGWALKFYEPGKVWVTLFFLSSFFLLYSLLAIFHNVLPKRPTRWFDVALTIANATFYFGLSYLMLLEAGFDTATPATQALLASIFFTGLFYTTWRWSSDDRLLRYSYVGAAATFLSMAVAIQLELHWVTIGWSIQALMLAWVGLRSREEAARHAAIAVFCVAVGHWFFWDMPLFAYGVDPSFLPLLNRRALSSTVLVGAIAGANWLYRQSGDAERAEGAEGADGVDESEREQARTFFLLTGNAVALTLLSLDLNDFFTARLSASATASLTVRGPIENARQFSLSTLWTLYAATMLAFGVLRRSVVLRWSGLLLLAAAIGKVVVLDTAFYAAWWHLPILNLTVVTYALLVAALVFAAWLYGRPPGVDEPEQQWVRPATILAANLLALTALSLEVLGYYERVLASAELQTASSAVLGQLQEGRFFTLALVWIIYATGAFLFGAWRNGWAWRWGGLLLLLFTTPLVLVQLTYYDASWHVLVFNRTLAAFALFVAALWLVARIYGRAEEKFEEASTMRTVAIIAANLFAILALSAQAAGYYDARIADEFRAVAAHDSGAFAERLRTLGLAKQLSLSVIWGLYASGMLIAGQLRRLRFLRMMALALLSLTTLKVFIWDVSSLDRVYRIISFILLGAILLVVSYFYQRSQQRAEEEEEEDGDQRSEIRGQESVVSDQGSVVREQESVVSGQ